MRTNNKRENKQSLTTSPKLSPSGELEGAYKFFKQMKQLLLTAVFLLCSVLLSAQVGTQFTSVNSDGKTIYYEITSDTEVMVTHDGDPFDDNAAYTGDVKIPNTVVYDRFELTVTSIGENAFRYCSELTAVTIPDSIDIINMCAFDNCSTLANVNISDSVETINNYAFSDCAALTSFHIPHNLKTIPNYCFIGSGLTAITIPETIERINDNAFSSTDIATMHIGKGVSYIGGNFVSSEELSSITVDAENPNFCIVEGVLFDKNKETLLLYPSYKTEESYTIPTTVSVIGSRAFASNDHFKEITFPENLTEIGQLAFSFRSQLTSITLPKNLQSIGYNAFYNCSNLSSITLQSTEPPYLNMGVFSEIKDSYEIYIPTEAAEAYANNDQWKDFNITLPEGVIGYKFSLNHIEYKVTDAENHTVMANKLLDSFAEGADTTVTIPATVVNNSTEYSVKAVGSKFLSWDNKVTTLTISEGITRLEERAIDYPYELDTLNLPASLTYLDDRAIWGCAQEILVINIAATTVPEIGGELDLPNGHKIYVPTGYEDAYTANAEWSKYNIIVPVGAKGYTFQTDGLFYKIIDADNHYVEIIMSETYQTLSTINITATVQNTTGETQTYSVKGISDYAFCYYGDEAPVVDLSIPEGITYINKGAFSGANISAATLPSTLNYIGEDAFKNTDISYISIPAGVRVLKERTFNGCASLSSITLAEGLEEIENYCFRSCNNLTNITLPGTIKTLGYSLFYECTNTIEVAVLATDIPTAGNNPFPTSSTVRVPHASLEAYKSTYPWKNFNILSDASFTITAGIGVAVSPASAQDGDTISISTTETAERIFVEWTATPAVSFDDATVLSTFFIMPAANVEITPVFSGVEYTLTFHINDGVNNTTATQTIEYGVAEALDANSFTREGYTFVGWASASNATEAAYTDGADITITANTDLYAVWVEDTETGINAAQAAPFTQVDNTLYFSEPIAVAVYNISGILLHNGKVSEYTLPSTGIYIIRTSVGSYKVLSK